MEELTEEKIRIEEWAAKLEQEKNRAWWKKLFRLK